MDSNKDAAATCYEKGVAASKLGNVEEALKWLNKSIRMYPTERAQALLDELASSSSSPSSTPPQHSQTQSPSPQASSHKSSTDKNSHSTSHTSTKRHTKEQADEIIRIQKCKHDYYAILNTTKAADANEIKKQYRKYALLMHPDKNHAPGAEEAFKQVSEAFACLSDADKRAHYDRVGYQTPDQQASHQHTQHFYRNSFRGAPFAQQMSPEDLFNMMFGEEVVFSTTHGNFRRHTRGPQQPRQPVQEPSLLVTLLQFLPILLLLFTIFTWGGNNEPLFMLRSQRPYDVSRTTRLEVLYWVQPKTENGIKSGDVNINQLEKQVDQEWLNSMQSRCNFEQQQKARMERSANYYTGSVRSDLLRTAKNYEMPSCDALRKKREAGLL